MSKVKMPEQRYWRDVDGDLNPRGYTVEDMEAYASAKVAEALAAQPFDMHAHLARQAAFSLMTFGPGARAQGVVDHIRKELREIEAAPGDLVEWIDVAILALDGAWRTGASPDQIIAALVAKQTKNEARTWPDWRSAPTDRAIEHTRDGAGQEQQSAVDAARQSLDKDN